MNSRAISKALTSLASLVLCTSFAFAQQAPPPPAASDPAAPADQGGPRPHMGPGMMRPGMMQQRPGNGPGNFRGGGMPNRGNMRGGFHGGREQGGFHIGPEGMWWRNPMVVQRLSLTADQTKKMDDIFQQSRLQLIDLRADVQKQEVMLEPLLSASALDSAKAMAQIDKVADARANLEKADAKMLLGIRGVLTPDQWTKLRTRGAGGPGAAGQPGPGGPAPASAPGGPGGPGGRGRGMRGGGPAPSTSNFVDAVGQP